MLKYPELHKSALPHSHFYRHSDDISLLVAPSGLECVLACQNFLCIMLPSMNRFLNFISNSNWRKKPTKSVCVPCRPNCTIMCLRFCTRQIDGVECGIFSIDAPLGQTHYVWNECEMMMKGREKVKPGAGS